jgi:hypothetical protein
MAAGCPPKRALGATITVTAPAYKNTAAACHLGQLGVVFLAAYHLLGGSAFARDSRTICSPEGLAVRLIHNLRTLADFAILIWPQRLAGLGNPLQIQLIGPTCYRSLGPSSATAPSLTPRNSRPASHLCGVPGLLALAQCRMQAYIAVHDSSVFTDSCCRMVYPRCRCSRCAAPRFRPLSRRSARRSGAGNAANRLANSFAAGRG